MSTLKATNIKNDSSASNNIVLDSGGGVVVSGVTTVSAGSASAPSITPSGDPNTGVFFPSADTIAFAEGGVESVRIDSSGRLGIGTVSPSYLLHLNGTSSVESRAITSGASNTAQWGAQNTTGATVVMGAGGSSYSPYGVIGVSNAYVYTGSDLSIATDGANAIKFATGAGVPERARIDSSGRLLVGTSTARSNIVQFADPYFQIEGTYRQSISVVNNENNSNAGGIALSKIRGTGIVSNGDISGLISFGGYDGSTFRETANIQGVIDGTPGSNDMPGRLIFSTTADGASSPTERMRIKSTGTVQIGNGTVGFTGALVVDPSSGAAGYPITVNNPNGGTTNEVVIDIYRQGNRTGYITNTNTATSYTSTSDYRVKENVTAITDGIARLQQLRPSCFNFIVDPGKTVDGFIAHEVQSVVPEAVTGEKDAVDDKGNPIYQGIDQSKLVPLLTAALQEAIGRIETLEAEVASLKAS